MKIKQLLENKTELRDELSDPQYNDYSHAIKRLLKNDWGLVRGSGYYDNDKITVNKPRIDRKPAYASTNLYHYAFKNLEPWINLPSRSVICSLSLKYASSFVVSRSSVFFIIPKNGTVLCELPEKDLWECFDSAKHFGLKARYKDVSFMAEQIDGVMSKLNGGIDITAENFIECLKVASKKLKEDDSILWEYSMTLQDKGFYRMVVDYFNIDVSMYGVNDIQFSGKDNEVWFSGEYLTIPYEMVELYL